MSPCPCGPRRGLAAILLATAVLLGAVPPARAQYIPAGTPMLPWGPTDGAVESLAVCADSLFIGGFFTQIGPPTGPVVAVDPVSGALNRAAGVAGEVRFIVADGRGGWFTGGRFHVPGRGSVSLARLHPDGSLDASWRPPAVDGEWSLVIAGEIVEDRLVIGGIFESVGGEARPGIAALDLVSGALLPWYPSMIGSPRPSVWAIAHHHGVLYIGGLFRGVGSVVRSNLVAVDAVSAQPLAFDLPASDLVRRFSVLGDTLYIGGNFSMLGNQPRYRAAAVSLSTGALKPWAPQILGEVWSLLALPGRVFVGGDAFDTVNGQPRRGLAALDPESGALLPFDADLSAGGALALAEHGGTLFATGGFRRAHGQSRLSAAAFDVVTGALRPWSQRLAGPGFAIATDGASVMVGGGFGSVGVVDRPGFARLDLATGEPLPVPATLDIAQALLCLGDVLVVGTARAVEAYRADSMQPLPWRQPVEPVTYSGTVPGVHTLASDGARLYVGGAFSEIGGAARRNLASFDLATGALTSWAPGTDGVVRSIAVAGRRVYVGGGFWTLPGFYGRGAGAAFDAVTGDVLSWDPRADGTLETVAVLPDRVVVGGAFNQLGRTPRAGAASVDAFSGDPLDRAPVSAFTTRVGRAYRGTLLLGGSFTSVDGYPRLGVAALDAESGVPWPWAPDLSAVGSFYVSGDGTIQSMAASDHRLAIGGRFVHVDGRPALHVAVFPVSRPGAPRALRASVSGTTASLSWDPGALPRASSYVVEVGSTAGATDIGTFPVSDTRASGTLPPGTYFVRVRGVAFSGAGSPSSEAVLTIPATLGLPGAPGPLTAGVDSRTVTLAWAAARGNPAAYVIEVGNGPGLSNVAVYSTGDLDTELVTAAPPGIYFVRVRASNGSGLGPPSNEVVVSVQ